MQAQGESATGMTKCQMPNTKEGPMTRHTASKQCSNSPMSKAGRMGRIEARLSWRFRLGGGCFGAAEGEVAFAEVGAPETEFGSAFGESGFFLFHLAAVVVGGDLVKFAEFVGGFDVAD